MADAPAEIATIIASINEKRANAVRPLYKIIYRRA